MVRGFMPDHFEGVEDGTSRWPKRSTFQLNIARIAGIMPHKKEGIVPSAFFPRFWHRPLAISLLAVTLALWARLIPAQDDIVRAPTPSPPTSPQVASPQAGLPGDQVVERVAPSVVLILVGQGGQLSGVGSGVVVRQDGILLTAYHLVRDARAVQVRLKNGEVYDHVELIDADRRRDVAALRIPAHGLAALPVARLEESKPGEVVYVVSNPGGLFWTASSGILSAVRPAEEVPGAGSGFRLVQFTAPVSPGSSGGALVDAQGCILGIIVGSEQGQNLNFALPVESVLGLADGTGRTAFGSGSGLQPPPGERRPWPVARPLPPAPQPAAVASELPQAGQPTAAFPEPATAAGPKQEAPAEILRSSRRIYIAGTGAFPPEPLEKKLFEQPEFANGEYIIVDGAGTADLVIELGRKGWTWDFTYRLTDPRTGVVLASGKVIAWDGVRAAPGIAKQIMTRLRALRGTTAPSTEKK
jgi:hypothetical protein